MRRVHKFLNLNWRQNLCDEEREQEHLIFKWRRPELAEFSGLFVYAHFFYQAYKEERRKHLTKEHIYNLNLVGSPPGLESLLTSEYLFEEGELTPGQRYIALYLAMHGKKKTADKFHMHASEISRFLEHLRQQ